MSNPEAVSRGLVQAERELQEPALRGHSLDRRRTK